MESIQYMGSKKNLIDFLNNGFKEYKIESFLDAFSGSVRVSYAFRKDYDLIVNDKQVFSKIIALAYLCNKQSKEYFKKYIEELNNLKGIEGWFSKHYATEDNGSGDAIGIDGKQKIWQLKNAMKLDAIRSKIEEYNLIEEEKAVLLLSLILGLNKVSNVVGHQNGYLKRWSKNSYNDLKLQIPDIEINNRNHIITNSDIFDLLPKINVDLAYFDPPYGTANTNLSVATRYSSFYHLWNTIVLNHQPQLFGKANKPVDTKGWTPPLEQNKESVIAPLFEKIITDTNAKYVAFSYSNQGLMKLEYFKDMAAKHKINLKVFEQEHKVNTQSKLASKDRLWVSDGIEDILKEYLFIYEK